MKTIEVDEPMHCMFRGAHEQGGKFQSWCEAGLVKKNNQACPDHEHFPKDCPLEQGVIVNQKPAEPETIPNSGGTPILGQAKNGEDKR